MNHELNYIQGYLSKNSLQLIQIRRLWLVVSLSAGFFLKKSIDLHIICGDAVLEKLNPGCRLD